MTPLAIAIEASAVISETASGAAALPASDGEPPGAEERSGVILVREVGAEGHQQSAADAVRQREQHRDGDEPVHPAGGVVGEREDDVAGAEAEHRGHGASTSGRTGP